MACLGWDRGPQNSGGPVRSPRSHALVDRPAVQRRDAMARQERGEMGEAGSEQDCSRGSACGSAAERARGLCGGAGLQERGGGGGNQGSSSSHHEPAMPEPPCNETDLRMRAES
jgi:hypothetical protein